MRKLIGIIILSILLTGSASSDTLTVDDSGGAMYTNIQEAINAASTGDTIFIYNGTYFENVDVNKSVYLVGAGAEDTIVNAFNPNDHVFSIMANNVNISGFTITGANGDIPTAEVYSGIYIAGGNITISKNKVFNNKWGIGGPYYSNNNLIGNTVFNNSEGIRLEHSSNNNLTGNNIFNNNYYGIAALGSGNNNFIGNNVYNNNRGFVLELSKNNNLIGNTVFNNSEGIRFFSSSEGNIIYNNHFNNVINIEFYIKNNQHFWNTTKTISTNIIGGPFIGGNFWANSSGTGFSQTCTDVDGDGICDTIYTMNVLNIDNLPLSLNFTTATIPLSSIGYSALVATGQNTFVQSSDGNFGLLLKGQTETISNSVTLNNTGDISAIVEARFNDSIGGVYGLINGTNVLNATNFALGPSGTLVPLLDSGTDVQVTIAPPGVTALDARLGVPADQAPGDYSGTVVLTFSNDV